MKKQLLVTVPFFVLQLLSMELAEKWSLLAGSFVSQVMSIAVFLPAGAGCLLLFASKKESRTLGEISVLLLAAFLTTLIFFYAEVGSSFPNFLEETNRGVAWRYMWPVFPVPVLTVLAFMLQGRVIRQIS